MGREKSLARHRETGWLMGYSNTTIANCGTSGYRRFPAEIVMSRNLSQDGWETRDLSPIHGSQFYRVFDPVQVLRQLLDAGSLAVPRVDRAVCVPHKCFRDALWNLSLAQGVGEVVTE